MSKLDLYYRAFKDYRKTTKNSADTLNERKNIIQVNEDLDHFVATKFTCTIEEDWVKEIEEGLKFVEKAIEEERQFIRVQGETIPIEKVKKVSRSSFEHLAKHSNLISHVPEDENSLLIPDELYIVEKFNDYAVYENRFLYMLLKYLQDFITFRIEKIEEIRNTYIGDFSIHKEVKSGKKEILYETKVYEKREDNPFPIPDRKTEEMIKRIKNCADIVTAFINCPLMTEVAKAPMLKPPITKTNVLKMNNNFKNALALYEYVSSYKGLGYTFEEVKTDFVPFNAANADELIDSIALTSFLTYKIGNDLEKTLETNYLNEEKEKKYEEERKLDDKIKRMKKKALESNKSMEEYMVMLETRNQQLLHDSEDLHIARNEILKLQQQIDNLNAEIKECERRIDDLKAEIQEKIDEIARLNQKYIEDMMALRRQHAEEMKDLRVEYEGKMEEYKASLEVDINNMVENHRIEMKEISDKHQAELDILDAQNQATIDELKEANEIEIAKYKERIQRLDSALRETEEDRDKRLYELESRFDDTARHYEDALTQEKNMNSYYINERDLYAGELNARRVLSGDLEPCDEFTTKERFDELEREYYAFEAFFNKQLKLTKKRIKESKNDPQSLVNRILNEENEKDTQEENEETEEK